MTLPALAGAFGVSKSTVHTAIREGYLPFFRIGTLYRVYRSTVPDFLVERWRKDEADRPVCGAPRGPVMYFIGGPPGFVKIGYSSDVGRRLCDLQPGSPYPLEVLAYRPNGSVAAERRYHRLFHRSRVSSEWFALSPEIQAEIDHLRNEAALS